MTITGYHLPAANISTGINRPLHKVRGERLSDLHTSKKECRVRDTPPFAAWNIRLYAAMVQEQKQQRVLGTPEHAMSLEELWERISDA